MSWEQSGDDVMNRGNLLDFSLGDSSLLQDLRGKEYQYGYESFCRELTLSDDER